MPKNTVARVFRVKMSENMSNGLEKLVEEGEYMSYADAIRHGIKILLDKNGFNGI